MKYQTKICIIDPNTCLVEHWEGVLEPIENPQDTLIEQLIHRYFSEVFDKVDKYETAYAIGIEYYEPVDQG